MPRISVLIVNYNGRPFLQGALESLERQTYKDFEILLIDNGSTDDSIRFVRERFPAVTVIQSPKNSFAIANNLGVAAARGELCLFLNNDVEVDPYCLEKLADAVGRSSSDTGMWATKIMNFYDRSVIDNTGLRIFLDGLARGRGRLEHDHGQFHHEEEVLCPSGCAALFKTDLVRSLGGFDEDFDFYVEDVDLGFRSRLAGSRCTYVPDAVVFHMYSATLGRQYSARKAFLVERNRVWFAVKNFPWILLLLLPLTSIARYIFQAFGVLANKGAAGKFARDYSRWQLVLVLLHAWIAACAGIPRMLRKRRAIQRQKKVSQQIVLSWFRRFGISAHDVALLE